jgi:hypothetical protein
MGWRARIFLAMAAVALVIPAAHGVMSQSEVVATVIPDQLNVREYPSFDAATLGSYTRGAVLHITGRDGTVWVFAIPAQGGPDSLSGWVHWDYVDFPAGFDVATLPIINAAGSGGASTSPDEPEGSSTSPSAPALAEGQLAGVTLDAVNFRAGPDTSASGSAHWGGTSGDPDRAIRIPRGARADCDSGGWLYTALVEIQGDVNALPVAGTSPAASASTSPPASSGAAPGIPSGVISGVGPRAREIFLAGQSRGNRANAFSKVGDSITDMPMFLYPIAGGQYDLGDYAYLQPVISHFSGSFGRVSAAAYGG